MVTFVIFVVSNKCILLHQYIFVFLNELCSFDLITDNHVLSLHFLICNI